MQLIMKKILITAFLLLLVACDMEPKVLHTVQYIADGHSTAFAQLRESHKVDYDSSSMGIFVKSIDGIAQSKTNYWLYYVNDESQSEAASKYVPAEGDTVQWRLVAGY